MTNRYLRHSLFVVLMIALATQLIMLQVAMAETAGTQEPSSEEDAKSPFNYWTPDDSRAFIPSRQADIPAGVKLVGVIMAKGRKAIAAITVPGFKEPFYVRVNDVIGIPATNSGRSSGQKTGRFADKNMTYIEVESIGKRQIKLFPKANPSNIQILQ